jgi:hypothetical protein
VWLPSHLWCYWCYRLIFVSNHLPLIVKRDEVSGLVFEWDEDALIAHAKEGLPEDTEAVYVGCLPVEVEVGEQEVRQGLRCCSSPARNMHAMSVVWPRTRVERAKSQCLPWHQCFCDY